MSKTVLLFNDGELWESNGAATGTFDITPSLSASQNGVTPQYIMEFDGEVLFEGTDSDGLFGLWMTNGTAAGTTEIGGLGSASIINANPSGLGPGYMQVYNNAVLFRGEAGVSGDDVPGLWATDGTASGTFEIGGAGNKGIANAYPSGLLPSNPDFTPFNGVVLFNGQDRAGNIGLWETNGTASGTFELKPIAGAAAVGTPGSDVQPNYMTVLGNEVLFDGADLQDTPGSLWETNGTAAGTVEIGGQGNAAIKGSPNGFTGQFTSELPMGMQPSDLTAFNGEALFAGYDSTLDSAGYYARTDALWESNGTAAGTVEIGGLGNAGISQANPAVDGGIFWSGSIEFPDFTVFNGEALFVGLDKTGHVGLWGTTGTASGTSEVGGLGNAGIVGGPRLSNTQSPEFTVYDGEVYFRAYSASTNQLGLWETNGAASGTHEVTALSGLDDLTVVTFADDYTGGGEEIAVTAGDLARVANTAGDWDAVTGSGATIYFSSAQASVFGGGDTVDFTRGSGDAASLYDTSGDWDAVSGQPGTTYLTSAQASVFGGGDGVYFAGGSGNAVSLYDTSGDWDAVTGSGGTIYLTSAQASVLGGGDGVYFAGGSGNAVSLYDTSGDWAAVTGSSGTLYLTSAQASVSGGGDSVYFASGSGNAISLYDTAGVWDGVVGSGGALYLTSAQTSLSGGGDGVYFAGGSGNAVSLYDTASDWDSVTGSSGLVYLTSSQASISGGLDTIDFAGGAGNAISIYLTNGAWDTVNGSNGTVYLTSAQASVIGGGDTVDTFGAGTIVSLGSAGGAGDAVNGSNAVVDLYGVTAAVTGSGDTMNFNYSDSLTLAGGSDTLTFRHGIGGVDVVSGFASSDLIKMSQLDFASFSALSNSGDLQQSGLNTVIQLNASDTITLQGVKLSSLTSARFEFV